jgi:hypothetical protein
VQILIDTDTMPAAELGTVINMLDDILKLRRTPVAAEDKIGCDAAAAIKDAPLLSPTFTGAAPVPPPPPPVDSTFPVTLLPGAPPIVVYGAGNERQRRQRHGADDFGNDPAASGVTSPACRSRPAGRPGGTR